MKVELIIAKKDASLLGVRIKATEGHHTMKMIVWSDGSVNHFYDGKCVDSLPSAHKHIYDYMYESLMQWGKSWILWHDFIPNCKMVLV
jgi:hypothetical protein